jgi:hypothetical protein
LTRFITFSITLALLGVPNVDAVCFKKVLLIGDSNMQGTFGRSLARQLKARGVKVIRKAKSGSGLARPDFFDWHQTARQLVRQTNPDAVVIIFGGNDTQGMYRAQQGPMPGLRWGDNRPWYTEYIRRLHGLIDILQRGRKGRAKRQIYLLSPTNRRPPRGKQRVQRLVSLQRTFISHRHDVRWIDAFALTSAPDGTYLSQGLNRMGRLVPYRRTDGIHLTHAGAQDLVRRIAPIIFSPCQPVAASR